LREALRAVLNPQATDGVISMHVIENDPVLSKPLTDKASDSDLGAGDWFVLIDATEIAAARDAVMRLTDNIAFKPLVASSGVYRLLWDIAKADISAEIS
jgi:hypothetical protein